MLRDFKQIIVNCLTFNCRPADEPIRNAAVTLEKLFDQEFLSILKRNVDVAGLSLQAGEIPRAVAEGEVDTAAAQPADMDWVQCERCTKWRSLAPEIDANALPDPWYCENNHWAPELAR